ncbi:MAG: hypothetical protein ACRDYD_03750, partial [Acidimicrobiales bacterium]
VDQGGSREVALSLAERMAESPRAALVAAKIALRSVAEPLGPQQWGFLGVLQRSLEGGPAQQEALERMRGARPGPG